MRRLNIILGDQLDRQSPIFDDFDSDQDAFWMAESDHEISYVQCHKQRIILFLSAMRHFREELKDRGAVHYHHLDSDACEDRGKTFGELLALSIEEHSPKELRVVQPGDYRVQHELETVAEDHNLPILILPDTHFYCTLEQFADFAKSRKSLIQETFYRKMRTDHNILMDDGDPIGGDWNYDHDNREPFPEGGPGDIGGPTKFSHDEITQNVMDLANTRYADHPGGTDPFQLPVDTGQARRMLADFIRKHLTDFGKYEDAMWTDEPFGHHSRLSTSLNLKLLNPRECVQAAIDAYDDGVAPLASVEGFVRQILGWREFIRGVYWQNMPEYAEKNHFDHQARLPHFYWDGKTEMTCVRQSMGHVIRFGYAHHIHRLMVLGNLALTLGVHPYKFHEWHMAMYLDAIDWVSLPNTLGMSQHGDGGIVGTKPYVSTGNYIRKMSNFCDNCQFNYKQATGKSACPITVFYWDFLDRHYDKLTLNQRMKLQMKHVENKRKKGQMAEIRERAAELRKQWYGN